MRRGVLLVAATAVALLLAPSAGAAFEARLRVNPSVVDVGRVVRIELRVFSVVGGIRRPDDQSRLRLRVEAVSPGGRVVRVRLRHTALCVWRGTYRFRTAGKWKVRIGHWPKGAPGPRLFVTVRPAGPTPPPAGFAAPGQANCSPPSPRNQNGDPLSRAEVFGTTVGGQFWGLFAFMPVADAWASEDTAVLQKIVGKEIKIVFKLTGGLSAFYAVAPTGTRTAPVWGPDFHGGSTWTRSGLEWGAGLVFSQVGCWRIHADGADGNAPVAGDIWLRVLS